MIVEFFLGVAAGIVQWFLTLLPDMTAAGGVIVTASNSLSSVLAGAGALSAWMPFEVLAITFGVVMTLYVGGVVLKIFLRLFSYVPFFGGAG
jgi:hypothetical protein